MTGALSAAFWISLSVGWIVLFWFYRDYSVDKFRQEMFALRDEMFDAANAGEIPFDHPSYRLLRSAMNGYIRFGHRLNLLSILFFIASLDEDSKEWIEENGLQARLDKAAASLPENARKQVKNYRLQMELLVAKQLIYGSPVLAASIILPAVFTMIIKFHLVMARRIRRHWRRFGGAQMDEAALAMGESA